MIKDHLRLLSLLHVFEQTDGHNTTAKINSFDALKWNLEKHIFTEEKVVFTSFDAKEKKEQYNLFLEISKEHTAILNEMAVIKDQLYKKIPTDGFRLREQLIKHQKYEEKLLYPRLDEELTKEEKCLILNRITEII